MSLEDDIRSNRYGHPLVGKVQQFSLRFKEFLVGLGESAEINVRAMIADDIVLLFADGLILWRSDRNTESDLTPGLCLATMEAAHMARREREHR